MTEMDRPPSGDCGRMPTSDRGHMRRVADDPGSMANGGPRRYTGLSPTERPRERPESCGWAPRRAALTPRSLELVIIGNGAAAAEAAQAARAAGYRGELDLFADNPYPPYNPMLGPYFVSGAISQRCCFPFGGAEFYERHRVRAHLGESVVGLAPWQKRLTTTAGREYAYGACLVASGARTAFPPIPGLDAPGVHGLRSFDDAVRLKKAAELAVARGAREGRRPRALVLGASFAGLKVADALRDSGMDVCIVEKEPAVLPLAVLPDCGALIEQHLRERGHRLLLGVTLDRVVPADGRLVAHLRDARGAADGAASRRPPVVEEAALAVEADPAAEAARAADADPIEDAASVEEADLLVVCTGSRSNLDFLADGRGRNRRRPHRRRAPENECPRPACRRRRGAGARSPERPPPGGGPVGQRAPAGAHRGPQPGRGARRRRGLRLLQHPEGRRPALRERGFPAGVR